MFSALFVFIAVIYFTSKLAENSEIIAAFASGVSFKRLLRPYMISAGIIAVLTYSLGAYVIPLSSQTRIDFEVQYKGKNIYDVLEMTAEEGLSFFDGLPRIRNKLQTLCDVGLGYIKIGQSSTELSGGEAQRVKLATELARRSTGKTVYILDEPTTGLHTADVAHLLSVLQQLCDAGNTVLVIEHNLDVIKCADYILDLGPEGGDKGGRLIAKGTPEEVAATEGSYTGQYLKKLLLCSEK
jgi:excinuclease ABC subunit A